MLNCASDLEKILKRLEYKVLSYQEISKDDKAFYIRMMQVSSDAFVIREEKRLYINNEVMPKRRLFTLAHELGHIVMDTDDGYNQSREDCIYGKVF